MEHDPTAAPEPQPMAAGGMSSAAPDPGDGETTSRRRFLRWLAGLTVFSTLAMIITPVIGFLTPPATGRAGGGGKVLAATTADIPPGGGTVVPVNGKPAIIVNTDQGVRAFSAICTHLGCVVAFNDLAGVIQCPCHDGRFNPVSGAVVSGPPPAPLPALTVSVEGDQVFVSET